MRSCWLGLASAKMYPETPRALTKSSTGVYDRRREQTRTRQAALDRPLRRLGDHDGRRVGGLSGQLRLDRLGRGVELAGEFRPVDADDDERAGPALDDFADGLAAPPKRGLPLLEDLGRQDLDVDARQLLRQRSPPATAPTRRRIVGVVDGVGAVRLPS